MTDAEKMEWFKSTFSKEFEDLEGVQDWKVLKDAAIFRKHTGDVYGAIEAMTKAICLTRTLPILSKETANNLNYLADLYLTNNAIDQAEKAIRESIALSRSAYPALVPDNLWILAGIQSRRAEYREALCSAEEARQLYQQEGHSYGVAQAEELIERIKTTLGR